MNTKAALEVQLSAVVKLMFFALVISTFLVMANKIRTSELHDLKVASRDVALAHDAVLASPLEVFVAFSVKQNVDLNIDVNNCIVMAKSKNKVDTAPSNFPCAKNSLKKIDVAFEENKVKILGT